MSYKVIAAFKDSDGTEYKPNDEYKGSKAKDRIKTLSTKDNDYGYPFIKEVKKKDKKEGDK